ncbi:MAG: outer membrane protein assembly factor BamE, partial [Rhodospirillales bacterium]|nr:outer membrane protein assembly factor BamE [Rhodospirillales bacterium]
MAIGKRINNHGANNNDGSDCPRGRQCRAAALGGLTALALALGSITACSPRVDTHGNTPDSNRLSEITPGVHTRGDVAQILGSPSTIALFDGETWYYIGNRTETTAFFAPDVVERQVVEVRFQPSGVVDSIKTLGMEDGQEIDIVDRETPT